MELIRGLRGGHVGCEDGCQSGRVGAGRRLSPEPILHKHVIVFQVPEGELGARLWPTEARLRSERQRAGARKVVRHVDDRKGYPEVASDASNLKVTSCRSTQDDANQQTVSDPLHGETRTAEIQPDRSIQVGHYGGVRRTRGKGREGAERARCRRKIQRLDERQAGLEGGGGDGGVTGEVPGTMIGDGAIGWTEGTRESGERWRPATTEARS